MGTSPVVVILRGPPGVGKTSVALLLRDRLAPAARLSVDLLRYLMHPRTRDERALRLAKIAAARLAVDLANGGWSSIIESVFLDAETLEECCEILRRGNVVFRVFSLHASLDEIERRDRMREPFDQQEGRVTEVYGAFGWQTGEIVETSSRLIEEVVAEILERLGSGVGTADGPTFQRRLCVFVRHGSAALDAARYQDAMEPKLTSAGTAAVAATAQALVAFRAERIVASPFQRAIDSAAIISKITSVPYEIDPELRERHFGSFAGRSYDQLRSEGIDVETLKSCSEKLEPPGEETVPQCEQRARRALQRIMSGDARRAIVVSHGGIHMFLLREFLKIPLDRSRLIALAAGRFSILEHRDNGELCGIRGINLSTWDELLAAG